MFQFVIDRGNRAIAKFYFYFLNLTFICFGDCQFTVGKIERKFFSEHSA